MKSFFKPFLPGITIILAGAFFLFPGCQCRSGQAEEIDIEPEKPETVTTLAEEGHPSIPIFEEDDRWYTSVKGHINPGKLINNETRQMKVNWSGRPVEIDLVHAYRKDEDQYVNIHSGEPLNQPYDDYGQFMWYLQISSGDRIIAPLFLHYYFNPHFVYEGDLDQDGAPDFGFLMSRESNLCRYALLTIQNDHWALLTAPFEVAFNLRASGLELAKPGDRKGEIKITRSGFNDGGMSTFMSAQIVDTVVVAKHLPLGDLL